ncbi:MAG: bifunctional [glutamine synthetase] adenylyltransferase/[glutamine synthetase]-adenylyl-L-tyrosine phosphorylase, partial [Hyphomicrobiales bacterium]|nr:bifunctional [glutamine synthetase] adenylyltransferase/[glutamine synthetase]-adenylyl-L-tyrosine phosphorylase [Hyphomicrobiales bacterium]
MNEAGSIADAAASGSNTPLAARLIRSPRPIDAAAAERFLDDLRERDREAEEPGALSAFLVEHEDVGAFLAGVMELSPYLRGLMLDDPARLLRILKSDPEARVRSLSNDARDCPASLDEAALMRHLRLVKQEAALAIALADLAGAWGVNEVTWALSRTADATLAGTIRWLLNEAAAAGRFTPQDADAPEIACGLIVLAMGKHGAAELNFSSDIDLIIFYDAAIAPLAEGQEPSTFFVRFVKRLVKIMQERTEHGYVFRVDLRLRPDPGATAVAINLAAAITYYEALGQNWERAALIKARPCAGDLGAGEDFLDEIAPFIWRKYFDYAAIADVHSI